LSAAGWDTAWYGWQDLLRDPLYIFRITEGGMSFHGGLAGVMLAMWLFSRRLRVVTWGVWDFVAPLAPLGLFFGRLGNFINGELWGKATDVPWAFDINGVGLHPSQLYEALLEGLLLFVILWQFSSKERPYMSVSGLFLLCYGAFRFFVEFYRVPDAHLDYLALGWVTMGQVLSAPMILLGMMLFMAYRNRGWRLPEMQQYLDSCVTSGTAGTVETALAPGR
jgi:phosphatidylglycerol:prolipoprotein diacylglycerol transferase